jgi:hypothetical protein
MIQEVDEKLEIQSSEEEERKKSMQAKEKRANQKSNTEGTKKEESLRKVQSVTFANHVVTLSEIQNCET